MKKIIPITLILFWLINCASMQDEEKTSSKKIIPEPMKRLLITPEEYSVIKKLRLAEKGEEYMKTEQNTYIVRDGFLEKKTSKMYSRATQIQFKKALDDAGVSKEGEHATIESISYALYLLSNCDQQKYCYDQLFDTDNDGIIDFILLPKKSDGMKCYAYVNSDGTQKSVECNLYNEKSQGIKRTIEENNNGYPNKFIYFDPSKETKSERCITKIENDTNNNGRLDKWEYYENCKLVRREIDENENGTKEEIIYYNQKGEYDRSWSIGGDNVKKANDALEAKKYDEAIGFYQAANQELSKEWGADTDKINFNLFQLTTTYMQKKEYQKCITTAKQLSDRELSDDAKGNVFFYSGTCQLMLRNFPQAEKDFETTIKFVESNDMKSSAHYNFACSLALQNKGGLALDHLKKAISFSADQGSVRKAAKKDSDFTSLVNDPEFKKLVE